MPVSSPMKSLSAKPKIESKPFIAYGYKDLELETGKKKTYNVLASDQVRISKNLVNDFQGKICYSNVFLDL